MHKSKAKNEYENGAKIWGWWLSLAMVKLHEIKSLEDNYMQLKTIGRTWTKIKYVRSQIKNPNF